MTLTTCVDSDKQLQDPERLPLDLRTYVHLDDMLPCALYS